MKTLKWLFEAKDLVKAQKALSTGDDHHVGLLSALARKDVPNIKRHVVALGGKHLTPKHKDNMSGDEHEVVFENSNPKKLIELRNKFGFQSGEQMDHDTPDDFELRHKIRKIAGTWSAGVNHENGNVFAELRIAHNTPFLDQDDDAYSRALRRANEDN